MVNHRTHAHGKVGRRPLCGAFTVPRLSRRCHFQFVLLAFRTLRPKLATSLRPRLEPAPVWVDVRYIAARPPLLCNACVAKFFATARLWVGRWFNQLSVFVSTA